MNFEQLEARYRELVARRQAGTVNAQEFAELAGALRTQDADQCWWQIDPASGHWLNWDGSQWRQGEPPRARAPGAQPPPAPGIQPAAAQGAMHKATLFMQDLWRRFIERMISPGEFLRQSRLPMAQRSQGWWDVLGVAGGALSGYLWFLYSSIRGMPHFTLVGMSGGRDVWYDFIPSILLATLPVFLFLYRDRILARLDPIWSKATMNMSYGINLAAVLVVGAMGLNYLSPALFSWAFEFREGLDFTTPLLMVGIPIGLAIFRPETDRLILPLQPIRQGIPKFLLVGVALAIPYALAFLLYRLKLNQYELLHWNLALGILIPYALLRNPQPALPPAGAAGTLRALVWLLPALLLLSGTLVPEAFADDCARDIFNLRDCLRTGGYAETMSGAAASAVSVLTNGAEIVRIFLPSAAPAEAPYVPATIYGSGTASDPYRDASAFKVRPDGRIEGYAETTQAPVIYGSGSAADPYRDTQPDSAPETGDDAAGVTTDAATTTPAGDAETVTPPLAPPAAEPPPVAPPPVVPPLAPPAAPPVAPPLVPAAAPAVPAAPVPPVQQPVPPPAASPPPPKAPAPPSAADRAARQSAQDRAAADGQTSWSEFLGNVWNGSRKDCGAVYDDVKSAGAWVGDKTVEAGKEVAGAVKDVYKDPRIIRDTVTGTARDIKDAASAAGRTTYEVGKDLVTHPVDIGWKTVTTTGSDAAHLGKKALVDAKDMVTNPDRRDHLIKNTLGINNFKNAMDPNVSPTVRLVNYGVGVYKVVTIGSNAATGTVRAGVNQAVGSLGSNKAVETLDKAQQNYQKYKPIIDAFGGAKSLDVDKVKMIAKIIG